MTGIKMYTTPHCPMCTMLKDHLDKKGIEYEVIDVTGNKELIAFLIDKIKMNALPILEVFGKYYNGVQMGKIDRILGLN